MVWCVHACGVCVVCVFFLLILCFESFIHSFSQTKTTQELTIGDRTSLVSVTEDQLLILAGVLINSKETINVVENNELSRHTTPHKHITHWTALGTDSSSQQRQPRS